MNVRNAESSDFEQITRIHAQMGMDYALPDLNSPLFFVRKVAEGENGQILGACFLRISAECYLWLEPSLQPRPKLETMQQLQPEVFLAAWQHGIDDVEARIPETVERRFQKRLHQLGWEKNRSGWSPWSAKTNARCG